MSYIDYYCIVGNYYFCSTIYNFFVDLILCICEILHMQFVLCNYFYTDLIFVRVHELSPCKKKPQVYLLRIIVLSKTIDKGKKSFLYTDVAPSTMQLFII